MEKNAEPSKLNSFDRTPVDEALDRQFQAVVDIIKSFSTPMENDEVDDVDVDQGTD